MDDLFADQTIEERLPGVRRAAAGSTTIRSKEWVDEKGRKHGGHVQRRQPWAVDLGPGPDGKQCQDCEFLHRYKMGSTFFKCGKQIRTGGRGTDIGARDPACRLFQQDGQGGQHGEIMG